MAYGLADVVAVRQMVSSSDADETRKQLEVSKLNALLGYCEVTTCRRETLLRYFSDHFEGPCGNCDVCLTPVDTWDATTAAQMALSCVYRTGQRFGVGLVVDVLLGKSGERIERLGHNGLSTCGIGTELDTRQWRSVFRQLIAQGLLEGVDECVGTLHLTESARPVLRGEQAVRLRTDPARPKRQGKRPSATDTPDTELDPQGRALFAQTFNAAPHDWIQITGGAIGQGFPAATGAALGCPERKVVCLQADGAGMYTLQALWTQAREELDVVNVVFANRRYQVLHDELLCLLYTSPSPRD